jgi:hypothetical protein
MTLSVDDRVVASGKATGLIRRQPQEDFCVGHDAAKPVTQYSAEGPFVGTIRGLKVEMAQ